MTRKRLTATDIKSWAKERGADLVGIAAATEINANPPDPGWPQTASCIWTECRSVIALGKRMPLGVFLAQDLTARLYTPHMVMNSLDTLALEVACRIEESGAHALPAPQQLTDLDLKRGTYGPLSLRHVAVEAGLGTLGLNLMLLTPQFGPRIYLTAVLSDAELEPDGRLDRQLCLGVACGRCLLACPPDAVGHWQLNKRLCSTSAQRFGAAAFLSHLDSILSAEEREEQRQLLRSMDTVGLWQALRTGAGGYGACLRCMEACPVGEDYKVHLKERHQKIPEATEEKLRKLQGMRQVERGKAAIPSLHRSLRWVGQ